MDFATTVQLCCIRPRETSFTCLGKKNDSPKVVQFGARTGTLAYVGANRRGLGTGLLPSWERRTKNATSHEAIKHENFFQRRRCPTQSDGDTRRIIDWVHSFGPPTHHRLYHTIPLNLRIRHTVEQPSSSQPSKPSLPAGLWHSRSLCYTGRQLRVNWNGNCIHRLRRPPCVPAASPATLKRPGLP